MVELGFQFTVMACDAELRVRAATEAIARAAAQAGMAEARRIEQRYSRYSDDSVVGQINAAAGDGNWLALDAEAESLLDFATALHLQSGGRFDITSGVLRKVWRFESARLPDAGAVRDALQLVGQQRLLRQPGRCRLQDAGMEIDLGGVGKEYAADRVAQALLAHGADAGFVNLGGDIRIAQAAGAARSWRFGVAHPRRSGAIAVSIELAEGALATSGDAERHIDVGGRRYGHILDARTGWPADGPWSVSVIAPSCAAAGALATLACLMGPQARAFLASQGQPHCIIGPDGVWAVGAAWQPHDSAAAS